jgi:glycerophosphoryl diester phosphodiesterase
MALISAYTAGADALEFDAQLTKDGQLVVSHDPTTERLTGDPRPIIELDFDELRKLSVSATFKPRGAKTFRYRPGKRPDVIERLPGLLDLLPRDVPKLIELKHDSSLRLSSTPRTPTTCAWPRSCCRGCGSRPLIGKSTSMPSLI